MTKTASDPTTWNESPSRNLTPGETAVLKEFRDFLMTPGKMLCFAGTHLDSLRVPLLQLTNKGFLVAEKFRGGYSLTDAGFAVMQSEK